MNHKLLTVADRGRTNVAELATFFERRSALKFPDSLHAFLKDFGGTDLAVPGPKFWREIARDQKIIQDLGADQSAESRLTIMRTASVGHDYLLELWQAAHEQALEPPLIPPNVGTRMEYAQDLCRRFRAKPNEVAIMLGLTKRERRRLRDGPEKR